MTHIILHRQNSALFPQWIFSPQSSAALHSQHISVSHVNQSPKSVTGADRSKSWANLSTCRTGFTQKWKTRLPPRRHEQRNTGLLFVKRVVTNSYREHFKTKNINYTLQLSPRNTCWITNLTITENVPFFPLFEQPASTEMFCFMPGEYVSSISIFHLLSFSQHGDAAFSKYFRTGISPTTHPSAVMTFSLCCLKMWQADNQITWPLEKED